MYLNKWIEVGMRVGITGPLGIPGENDNGRRVIRFSAEIMYR